MILGITYTNSEMTISANRCARSMLLYGADEAIITTPECIDQEFYEKNKALLTNEHGAGLWLWKPYMIDKYLSALKDGDYLLYSDAGVEIINDLFLLLEDMNKDVLTFRGSNPHIKYCKKHVLDYYGISEAEAKGMYQLQSSFIIVRNTEKARKIVSQWLDACQNEKLLNDETGEEYLDFVEHKHDQAILTSMMADVDVLWWATNYEIKPGDGYIIFNHHRKRNYEYKQG